MFNDEADNKRIISAYIFHCNVHNPTGEAAFHNLMKGPAYAKVRFLLASVLKGIYAKRHICKKAYTYVLCIYIYKRQWRAMQWIGVLCSKFASYAVDWGPMK